MAVNQTPLVVASIVFGLVLYAVAQVKGPRMGLINKNIILTSLDSHDTLDLLGS